MADHLVPINGTVILSEGLRGATVPERRQTPEGVRQMSFDGEAYVDEMREELIASGRTLDKARWVEQIGRAHV